MHRIARVLPLDVSREHHRLHVLAQPPDASCPVVLT